MEFFINAFKKPTGQRLASLSVDAESEDEALKKMLQKKPDLQATPITITFEKIEKLEYEQAV